MKSTPLSLEDFIDYEIAGSCWAWITPSWLEEVVGNYFAWKAKRKYRRYAEAVRFQEMMGGTTTKPMQNPHSGLKR